MISGVRVVFRIHGDCIHGFREHSYRLNGFVKQEKDFSVHTVYSMVSVNTVSD